MKITRLLESAALLAALIYGGGVSAQNPIIQTKFTSDPAPMVYNDTVYLYVDHDEDTNDGFFNMKEWLLYKSADMVNWTDCGVVGNLQTFAWGNQNNGAWAMQCIPRNGKFYLYCPIQLWGIGVAVADNPNGPFKDALGKFLINNSSDDIDPTAFIDDDGQAYLYWGNPKPYYVKLNEDMISYSGSITTQTVNPDNYTEGPWIYKRNGTYYLLYASHGIPENLSYATSSSPTGPWTYQGIIMKSQDGCAFTNHCGVVDFKGSSYIFYHDQRLSKIDGFRRSVSVEKFSYNADGSIPTIGMTADGVTTPVCNVNPYSRVEAETIAFESGIETNRDDKCGMYVDSISNGDYIKVRSVDFGSTGAAMFTASTACSDKMSRIELHLDSPTGTLAGTLRVNYSAGEWKTDNTVISNCTGVHDLYIVFKGNASNKTLFKFDWWKMTEKTADKKVIGVNAYSNGYDLDTKSGANTTSYYVYAIYSDGTSEDVTQTADVVCTPSGACTAANGTITANEYGTPTLTFTYQGMSDSLPLVVEVLDNKVTVSSIEFYPSPLIINLGGSSSFTCNAVYKDGHKEDITNEAAFTSDNKSVATASDGNITGKSEGTANVTVSWKGSLGDAVTGTLPVTVNGLFPLTDVNPDIFGDGTYDVATTSLTTGQYGFGGWKYPNSVDLSGYSSIVVTLQSAQSCGAQFRIFDENNYWGSPSITDFGTNTSITIDLASLKNDKGVALNLSHICIAGFWSYGGSPIAIKSITLVKNTTGIENIQTTNSSNKGDGKIYNLAGMRMNVSSTSELLKGIYIVNGKKVVVGKK